MLSLSRLFIFDDYGKSTESVGISKTFNWLKENAPEIKALISYSDPEQGHMGIIYQATNWIYTGKTKERTDIGNEDGTHSRHYDKSINTETFRKFRSSKYRYIFFTGSKTQRKIWNKKLNYPKLSYPKGDNKRYDTSHKTQTQLKIF